MHKTKQGQTWDMISIAEYGTPHRIADLIAANPSLAEVLIFEEGTAVNIPEIKEDTASGLPPWKRSL